MKNLNYVFFALIAGIVFEGVLSAEWYSMARVNLTRTPKRICPGICSEQGATWSGESKIIDYHKVIGACNCIKADNS
jgi:hypothetical protein